MLFGLIRAVSFGIRRVKPNRKFQVPFKRWSIVRGDEVQLRSGDDKGKIGQIIRVYRKSNTVTVKDINIKTKAKKSQDGGISITKKPYPVHVSKVGLFDPVAKRAVRVRYAFDPNTNQKLRISKKTGSVLKKPVHEDLKREKRGQKRKIGIKDTAAAKVTEVTYQGQDFEAVKREFQQFIKEKEEKEKYLIFNH